MYNRYIPQPDGSFRKNRVQDAAAPPPRQHSQPEKQAKSTPSHEEPRDPPVQHQSKRGSDAGDFLRRLLPKDLDTEDLMIILLLLLMAGDKAEDKSNALLTLALYLFM